MKMPLQSICPLLVFTHTFRMPQGNAPLDALLHGLMVLLPSYDPPIGRCARCVLSPQGLDDGLTKHTTNRFKGQPNDLALISQNPYISALGAPDAWTVDVQRADVTESALQQMKSEYESRQSNGGYELAQRSRLPLNWTVPAFLEVFLAQITTASLQHPILSARHFVHQLF